jgi:hypothetical protein
MLLLLLSCTHAKHLGKLLTKEEGLGKNPLHILGKIRLSAPRIAVIVLVVIIVVGGVAVAYIVLRPPSSPQNPSNTHTVNHTAMMSSRNDYWNITVTGPYSVILNDSMTVSSGDQDLQVVGLSSNITNIWEVFYVNGTCFQYVTWDAQGNQMDSGWLNCSKGLVQVVVTATTITFTGTASFTSNIPFVNLGEVWTANSGGNFNSGELDMTLTIM